MICGWLTCRFQSTLSMRRATEAGTQLNSMLIFQSTLSMRRATGYFHFLHGLFPFQSTLSMRRATATKYLAGLDCDEISIHALHEESDL